MADEEKKYVTDEQTGKLFEKVPEQSSDEFWANVSFVYLACALVFFLWLLFDIWLQKYTFFTRWLGYSSIEASLGKPIFRSFAYSFIGGALGGTIAGYRSCIFWHGDEQAFGARFFWRYLFFPGLGGTLALFVYAILGSGVAVVGGNVSFGATNMMLALAIGSLVGYGSPQVVKWLDSQVNKLFKVAPAETTSRQKVPDLIGLTEQEARKKLVDAGLSLGLLSKKHQVGATAGRVIEQDPSSGTEAPAKTSVKVVIAE
jgi:hypothetical protein